MSFHEINCELSTSKGMLESAVCTNCGEMVSIEQFTEYLLYRCTYDPLWVTERCIVANELDKQAREFMDYILKTDIIPQQTKDSEFFMHAVADILGKIFDKCKDQTRDPRDQLFKMCGIKFLMNLKPHIFSRPEGWRYSMICHIIRGWKRLCRISKFSYIQKETEDIDFIVNEYYKYFDTRDI